MSFDPDIGRNTQWRKGEPSPNPAGRPPKRQLKEAQLTVDQLGKAIRVLEGLGRNGVRPTLRISAAQRRRIAEAQRNRWAKLRLAKKH